MGKADRKSKTEGNPRKLTEIDPEAETVRKTWKEKTKERNSKGKLRLTVRPRRRTQSRWDTEREQRSRG